MSKMTDERYVSPKVMQTQRRKTWKEKVFPVLNAVQPVTRVMASVANVAVHLKKPTVMGVAMAASAGANALRDLLIEPPTGGTVIQLLCGRGYMLEAFRKAGANVRSYEAQNGMEVSEVTIHGMTMRVLADNSIYMADRVDDAFYEWLRQLLDTELPPVIEVRPDASGDSYTAVPTELTMLRSVQGPKILSQTLPMLNNNRQRAILLTGVPGVGKSTMAQEIARLANLGRVVRLASTVIGHELDSVSGSGIQKNARVGGGMTCLEECIKLLSPGVVIVDDIHRISLSLVQIEALRKVTRLVIFTANLPEDDHGEVLDGAEIRSGRIDEVFSIEAEHSHREPPFDRLSDEVWERVRFWPIAFLNDLEVRLLERPNDLRLEDLERRVGMKTRNVRTRY